MKDATKLGLTFLSHELHWSSLLVAQSTLPNPELLDYFCMLSSLHRLGFNKALQNIVDSNPDLLKVEEMKLLYIKSGKDSSIEVVNILPIPSTDRLCPISIGLFFSALSKQESLRKKQLVMSFEQDRRNIEPLIYLYKEALCVPDEISAYADTIPNEYLKKLIKKLISNEMLNDRIVCPLVICALSYHLLFEKTIGDCGHLFRICARHVDLFNNCEFIFLGMGIHYMRKEKYKEALGCFYRAIETNRCFGPAHLLAGVCHSRMKETEYAVKILGNAYSIMSSSHVPAYCLAYEYQVMNNMQKAKHYFKRSIDLMTDTAEGCVAPLSKRQKTIGKEDRRVVCSFIYCLVYNEEYEEAMKYLEIFEVKNILRVFCLLFTGAIENAREELEECVKDSSYYVCKGFIAHLVDELESAIENYEKGLESEANTVIESLLDMAYENIGNRRPNRAFDYSNCLFESFGFKNRIFN